MSLEVKSGCRVSTTLGVAEFGWPDELLASSHLDDAATYVESEIGGLW
jgi:hypothetical protein